MLTRLLEAQRVAIAGASGYESAASLKELDCDAFVVELDTDEERALAIVEEICAHRPAATVMVYSDRQHPDVLVRCMRAGAREFLTHSTSPATLAEALSRAAARRAELSDKKTRGKILTFWGAKGGSGVSTIAANFAIALRQESRGEVALADLNPDIGDAALLLGITPRFTIEQALANPHRIDDELVASLATPHSSGLSVLAAPDTFLSGASADGRGMPRFLESVSSRYPYSVVDAGRALGREVETLFRMSSTVYLVTQVDVTSLRNTQRISAYLAGTTTVELVINRFEARKSEFDEERLRNVLGVSPRWRVPNDYNAARRASNTGTPLMSEKSPISSALREMARVACGLPAQEGVRRGFKLFG